MSYENPEVPEGINDSDRRPLLNFLRLTAAAAALVAAAGAALFFLADRLAPLVPFTYEAAVAGELFGPPGTEGAIEPYLRELAARLVRAQDLPAEMTVTVHYDDGPVVNAFATLGGHVVLYQGLLETAADENALAMVIAHEIAHVRDRAGDAAAGVRARGRRGGLLPAHAARGGPAGAAALPFQPSAHGRAHCGAARDGARTPFPAAVRDDIERRRTSKLKPDARAPLQSPR